MRGVVIDDDKGMLRFAVAGQLVTGNVVMLGVSAHMNGFGFTIIFFADFDFIVFDRYRTAQAVTV